jgi:hypothetical protein
MKIIIQQVEPSSVTGIQGFRVVMTGVRAVETVLSDGRVLFSADVHVATVDTMAQAVGRAHHAEQAFGCGVEFVDLRKPAPKRKAARR